MEKLHLSTSYHFAHISEGLGLHFAEVNAIAPVGLPVNRYLIQATGEHAPGLPYYPAGYVGDAERNFLGPGKGKANGRCLLKGVWIVLEELISAQVYGSRSLPEGQIHFEQIAFMSVGFWDSRFRSHLQGMNQFRGFPGTKAESDEQGGAARP